METIDILLKMYSEMLETSIKEAKVSAAKFKAVNYEWAVGYYEGRAAGYEWALYLIKALIDQRERDAKK